MSNQMEDGWYPECDDCGCGNLCGSITLCDDCLRSMNWECFKKLRDEHFASTNNSKNTVSEQGNEND